MGLYEISKRIKMSKFKIWLELMRPNSILLSISGVTLGSLIAFGDGKFNLSVSILAIFTAMLFQILSNFANDLGDFTKDADLTQRKGVKRGLQRGIVSIKELKVGMFIVILLATLSSLCLIFIALQNSHLKEIFIFIILALFSIIAALKYTLGKTNLAYSGLADMAVFIFFGLLGVLGSYYLNSLHVKLDILYPAIAMGCFSTGVLNINNIRDIKSDTISGRKTIPIRIGKKNAKIYQITLITIGILINFLYFKDNLSKLIYLFPIFILLLADLYRFLKVKDEKEYNPFLKKLSLKSFFYALLFALANWI